MHPKVPGVLRISTALALMSALLALAGSAQANGRATWQLGVFPVVSFEGYTSGFGMRVHPVTGGVAPHEGIDIAAPLGSPVRSWWSGTVNQVIQDGGCGNGLVIRSGHYEHIYCHLAGGVSQGAYRSGPVQIRQGQRVARGQTIAHVGVSGNSTGPHLHWGLRYRGEWLDPARVLRAMAASRRNMATMSVRKPNVGPHR